MTEAPQARESRNRELILETLKQNERGLTINDLAGKTKLTRDTIVRHVTSLAYQDEIYTMKYGNVSVYYPNHRQVRGLDRLTVECGPGRTIYLNMLRNQFGDFLNISELRNIGGQSEKMGSIILPPEYLKELITSLQQIAKRRQDFGAN